MLTIVPLLSFPLSVLLLAPSALGNLSVTKNCWLSKRFCSLILRNCLVKLPGFPVRLSNAPVHKTSGLELEVQCGLVGCDRFRIVS